MRVSVFTARSSAIGIAVALLVATALKLIGASWSLAIANALATAGLVLLVAVARRLGRFSMGAREPSMPPWLGVWMVGYATMYIPVHVVLFFVELDISDRFALASLFGLAAVAAYACGDIVATLGHLDRTPARDDAAPPDRDTAD